MSKNENMNKENKKETIITEATHIVFTVKTFILFMIAILSLFYGFYEIVVNPSFKDAVTHQKELYNDQKVFLLNQFNQINTSIKSNSGSIIDLNTKVNNLNSKIGDLERSMGSINSGGSFTNTQDKFYKKKINKLNDSNADTTKSLLRIDITKTSKKPEASYGYENLLTFAK